MTLNDGRVVTNFISQALQNEPITIYGDGQQTRSFCYVDDLIDGLIKLFFTDNIYEPINLGNPTPITMLQLANEVIDLTNSCSQIVFKDLPGDDPRDREPDISRARNLIGWDPKISRKAGLDRTIQDLKAQLSII
jgi:nucleoside-diphosphate-sugar epimerase